MQSREERAVERAALIRLIEYEENLKNELQTAGGPAMTRVRSKLDCQYRINRLTRALSACDRPPESTPKRETFTKNLYVITGESARLLLEETGQRWFPGVGIGPVYRIRVAHVHPGFVVVRIADSGAECIVVDSDLVRL